MATFRNGGARLTYTTWIDGGAALPIRADAIQRLCNEAGRRGFTNTAHTGHQEGMGKAATLDRVTQRLHHGILTDQFAEIAWSIFASKYAVRLRGIGHRLDVAGWMDIVEGLARVNHASS